MKIKLFLTSSLLLLGVWITAAYNHTIDLSTYSAPRAKSVEAEKATETESGADEALLDLATTQ